MSSYQWGITILHYKTVEITRKCIEILEKVFTGNIVIVDNGSNDGSGEKLRKEYSNVNHVHVILLEKNLGFSKGNNVGYMFLKRKGCDFIIMLNNDAFIFQKDFFKCIIKEYEKNRFDIMGPMILDAEQNVVNSYPQKPIHTTVASTYMGQAMCIIKWLLSFVGLDRKTEQIVLQKQQQQGNLQATQRYENVLISGCCLIFAKGYIDKFDGLNQSTFLYLEEEILFARAKKCNLKIVYCPEIKVIHIGEASTAKVLGNNKRKQRRFRYRNQFFSFFVLKKEIISSNKNKFYRRFR